MNMIIDSKNFPLAGYAPSEKRFGQLLKRWLRQPDVFRILDRQNDRDAAGLESWTPGGCRVLAEALASVLPRYHPDYQFGPVTTKLAAVPQHVALEVRERQSAPDPVHNPLDAFVVDADGSFDKSGCLHKYQRAEKLNQS